jgi:hypothetical protein
MFLKGEKGLWTSDLLKIEVQSTRPTAITSTDQI